MWLYHSKVTPLDPWGQGHQLTHDPGHELTHDPAHEMTHDPGHEKHWNPLLREAELQPAVDLCVASALNMAATSRRDIRGGSDVIVSSSSLVGGKLRRLLLVNWTTLDDCWRLSDSVCVSIIKNYNY